MKQNRPDSEINRRIYNINVSTATSFRELLNEGEFDPSRDMRYGNLSGLSFAGEDLRGIDFTGANLVGCDFTDALIKGARFDQARVGCFSSTGLQCPNFRQARDWVAFIDDWGHRAPRRSEDHLPVGSIFMDTPYLPLMVVSPIQTTISKQQTRRLAVSLRPISVGEVEFLRDMFEDWSKIRVAENSMRSSDAPYIGSFVEVNESRERIVREARLHYELPTESEWAEIGVLWDWRANGRPVESIETGRSKPGSVPETRARVLHDESIGYWCRKTGSRDKRVLLHNGIRSTLRGTKRRGCMHLARALLSGGDLR